MWPPRRSATGWSIVMVRRGMRLNELANRLAVAADLRFDPQDVFRRAILIPYSMLARTAVTVKAASRGR